MNSAVVTVICIAFFKVFDVSISDKLIILCITSSKIKTLHILFLLWLAQNIQTDYLFLTCVYCGWVGGWKWTEIWTEMRVISQCSTAPLQGRLGCVQPIYQALSAHFFLEGRDLSAWCGPCQYTLAFKCFQISSTKISLVWKTQPALADSTECQCFPP